MHKMISVPGYVHARGVHCATAALRNVVRHATGVVLSESTIFGIASGLNFTYSRFPGSRLISINGRGTDLEINFADAMGIGVETSVVLDDAMAWEHVQHCLDAGQIVMLDTDSFSLPYLTRDGLLPDSEDIHFGGHRVLITGYCAERKAAIMHDYAWPDAKWLPLEQLRNARNPANCPIAPPMNRTFIFTFGERPPDIRTAMLAGLLRTAPLMKNSIAQSTGFVALDRFCRQVTRWPRLLGERDTCLNARVTGYMLEKGGTGGGAFRMFFSRFLQECSRALDCPELGVLSMSYRNISGKWSELAALLTESSLDLSRGLYEPRQNGAKLVDEIWNQENTCVRKLEEIIAELLRNVETSTASRGTSSCKPTSAARRQLACSVY